jgi:prevent-host-death family protein
MTTVTAYEAKTHLPRLLRAAERGETVIITRHGKPVAQLGPVEDRRREGIAAVIERMKRARAQRPRVTVEEILAARDEGRKP